MGWKPTNEVRGRDQPGLCYTAAPRGRGSQPSSKRDAWPDMLADDISDDDISRYEHAKRAGDPTSVMALLRPSSMSPMLRVCEFFEINPDKPSGTWRKPPFWSRLFGPST